GCQFIHCLLPQFCGHRREQFFECMCRLASVNVLDKIRLGQCNVAAFCQPVPEHRYFGMGVDDDTIHIKQDGFKDHDVSLYACEKQEITGKKAGKYTQSVTVIQTFPRDSDAIIRITFKEQCSCYCILQEPIYTLKEQAMLRFLILLTLALLIAAPAAAQSGVVWKAEYYDNPYLIGSKEYEQQESAIAFDWGLGSPRDLPDDNFSIRFTTDVYFPAGTYRFSALADDRVRVSVAFAPVINTFDKPQPGVLLSADVPLPEGVHHIQVDYREETKEAYVNVGWALLTPGSDAPQLPVLFTSAPALTPNPWQAAYFDNPNLNEPHVFKRNEPSASRTFNTDPPRPGMPADNFSVRWESIQPLDDGTYQIRVR